MSNFNEEALDLTRQGRSDEAEAVLVKALDAMPNDWISVQVKEDCDIGHFWDEEEFFAYCEFRSSARANKSIYWLENSYSYAVYLLAALYVDRGELERALELLEVGLRMEPDHPGTLCEFGYVLQSLKRYESALEMYQKAQTLRQWATDSQKARALRGQGYCLIEVDRLDDAEGAFNRSLGFEPESENALKELAYISKRRGQITWPFVDVPKDPLTVRLIEEGKDLPSVPGPQTVGTQNFKRISDAFCDRGWEGFEEEFANLYPAVDPGREQIKGLLLREPIFRPRIQQAVINMFDAFQQSGEKGLNDVLNKLDGEIED